MDDCLVPPTATPKATTYELPLNAPETAEDSSGVYFGFTSLPEPLLIDNALWFCRLRWIVVGSLLAFGVAGYVPGLLEAFALRPGGWWPFAAAGILSATNLAFLFHAGLRRRPSQAYCARINLWGQITLDLLVLTGVVHFVGSLETNIAFAYLFHIVLACIFLSRSESFLATMMACVAYAVCVGLEGLSVIQVEGVFTAPGLREGLRDNPAATATYLLSTVAIWLVVWYLASRLSAIVRQRDHQLAETNRKLEEAQIEKAKHMARTTHELKAPFSAIQANVDLLVQGYCGSLPDAAVGVLSRVSARCDRLVREIQEMLHLASFRSEESSAPQRTELDLAGLLKWTMEQVEPLAERRDVALEDEVEEIRCVADREHMTLLFMNLLSNAVLYSREGGRVLVKSSNGANNGGPVVVISDSGIGIPAEKLPEIFEEYYRTEEAVRHNQGSSGLGLAIVKHVAESHGIRVTVRSEPGAGTSFSLHFPRNGIPKPGKVA